VYVIPPKQRYASGHMCYIMLVDARHREMYTYKLKGPPWTCV